MVCPNSVSLLEYRQLVIEPDEGRDNGPLWWVVRGFAVDTPLIEFEDNQVVARPSQRNNAVLLRMQTSRRWIGQGQGKKE